MLLRDKQLCPTTVEIHDERTMLEPSDPEVASLFATDLLEDSGMDVMSFSAHQQRPW